MLLESKENIPSTGIEFNNSRLISMSSNRTSGVLVLPDGAILLCSSTRLENQLKLRGRIEIFLVVV
jgi:hypothetical protein